MYLKYFRPIKHCKWLYTTAKSCTRFYSPLSFKYYVFFISYLRCYLKGGFYDYEVFQLGLGSFFTPAKRIEQYVGGEKMRQITSILNPLSWNSVSSNKGLFYLICKNFNLPIPELYAIIFKYNLSISYLNSSLLKKDDLIGFIREVLPSEFVIKPELGTYGRYVNVYTKSDRGINDGCGNILSEKEIVKHIFSIEKYNSFIVQERLKNHHDILNLFPSESLHNIRIITLIDSSKSCKILHAHLNIATEENITSQSGSLKASISLNDGNLEYGVFIDKNKGGFKKISEHPETGIKFNEFYLPLWDEILSLAKEAALKFLPLRSCGWDIAITDKGLKILETNAQPYAPPNLFQSMDEFIKILLSDQ